MIVKQIYLEKAVFLTCTYTFYSVGNLTSTVGRKKGTYESFILVL